MFRRIPIGAPFEAILLVVRSVELSASREYGAPRFKPKTMKVRQQKTPSMLALDHFDFYYAPLFGKKWPSIRLGLLCQHKFVAVMNRFSMDYEINQKMLEELGTVDLIQSVTQKEFPSARVEKRRLQAMETYQDLSKQIQEKSSNVDELAQEEGDPLGEVGLRTETGLGFFREEKQEFTMLELSQKKSRDKDRKLVDNDEEEETVKSRQIIRDSDFQVTGLEGLSVGNLPTVDDFIYYPRDLSMCVFGRGILDDFPGPMKDKCGISSWWLLDGGSVLPVLALDLNENDDILDMCASPGGKSMLIIQSKRFKKLVCNDNKLSRLGQLRRALAMYIPDLCEETSRIIIKRKDGSSVESWDELDGYDKVLVDAPCTTDRLAANTDKNNLFTVANTTDRLNLPQLQTKLLVNALRSVRVGGSVVYSTCTLAPTQNEIVVENASALAESYFGIRCAEQSLKHMEKHLQTSGLYWFANTCKRGILVLPTVMSNFGPMYVCKLKRLA